jgi:hypothetical protein
MVLSILTWACLACHALSGPLIREETQSVQSRLQYLSHAPESVKDAGRSTITSGATAAEINTARRIVKDAITKMGFLNKARLDKPARNQHNLKHGTHSSTTSSDSAPPPLLKITPDIASAAALLAELDTDVNVNVAEPVKMSANAFWMEGIARKGTVPWGNDPGYKASTARFPMIYTC